MVGRVKGGIWLLCAQMTLQRIVVFAVDHLVADHMQRLVGIHFLQELVHVGEEIGRAFVVRRPMHIEAVDDLRAAQRRLDSVAVALHKIRDVHVLNQVEDPAQSRGAQTLLCKKRDVPFGHASARQRCST